MQTFGPSTTTIFLLAATETRRTMIAQQLEALGHHVIALTADQPFEQVLKRRHYDLLLLDLYTAAADTASPLATLAATMLVQGTPVLTLAADQSDQAAWTQAVLRERIDTALQGGSQPDVLLERMRHWDGLNVLDPQTSLFNRRYFDALLPTELERARRLRQPMTLLLFDLAVVADDNITMWRSISGRLLTSLRQTDLVARYTPSLVAVVLPATDASLARIVAARLCRTLQGLNLPLANTSSLMYGMAAYPQHGTTPATLIAAAQYALMPDAVPASL